MNIANALKNWALTGEKGLLPIPLGTFALKTGVTLATFANASTNTPGIGSGSFDESLGIRWNNASSPDPVAASFVVPPDFNPLKGADLHILCAKVGATDNAGNTVTWLVEFFNNVLGALYNADADYGGTSSAMAPAVTSLTVQEEILALDADDLPSFPGAITMTIQPTDNTLDTDDVIILGLWIEYVRRPVNRYQ